MEYGQRQFMIFNVSELPLIDFTQVLETSIDTVRKSVDETKTFVKWDGNVTPSSVDSLTTKEGPYTYEEILNILLTKYNFLKKSKIIIKGYEIDSNQRLIMKKGTKAKLTEKELELILTLNKNNGLDKSFLLSSIWNHTSDLESHAFETHLHRLRKKINNIFEDNKFIIEENSRYYLLTK